MIQQHQLDANTSLAPLNPLSLLPAGVGTAAFLIFYQWVVEPAPPGSLPVRTFAWAAQVGCLPLPQRHWSPPSMHSPCHQPYCGAHSAASHSPLH
jgi:hypothetical protein